jgi:hypothetical protein
MRIRCTGLAARMREKRNGWQNLVEKPEMNTRRGWNNSSKISLREMEYGVWTGYK